MIKKDFERIKQQIRSSPPGVKTASTLLSVTALLVISHRTYFAYSHEIALWKGLVGGLFLAMFIWQAGFMLFQKKAWLYWTVLLVSLGVSLFSTIHGLAELLQFVHGQLEDFVAFAFTVVFWLLSVGIVCSLLRRQSREYFRAEVSS